MAKKILPLTIVMLLLIYSNSAISNPLDLNCGSKEVAACKTEFVAKMNERFSEVFLGILKIEVNDVMKVFNAVLRELPAESADAKMLEKSVNYLKNDLENLNKQQNDYPKMRETIHNIELNIQPHITLVSPFQNVDNLEKILDKHNYTQIIRKTYVDDTMTAFTSTYGELFNQLRDKDLKAYSAYSDINETLKALANEKDQNKQNALLRNAVVKIRAFCTLPIFEEVVFYRMNDIKKQ